MSGARAADGGRELTGRKVALIALSVFTVVTSVNVYMMVAAIGGFPGLVTPNSYVASQSFDADRKAQIALGWSVSAAARGGALEVRVTDREGAPVRGLDVSAILGRAASVSEDREIRLSETAGGYVSEPVGAGRWRVAITVDGAGGGRHRSEAVLWFGGEG